MATTPAADHITWRNAYPTGALDHLYFATIRYGRNQGWDHDSSVTFGTSAAFAKADFTKQIALCGVWCDMGLGTSLGTRFRSSCFVHG